MRSRCGALERMVRAPAGTEPQAHRRQGEDTGPGQRPPCPPVRTHAEAMATAQRPQDQQPHPGEEEAEQGGQVKYAGHGGVVVHRAKQAGGVGTIRHALPANRHGAVWCLTAWSWVSNPAITLLKGRWVIGSLCDKPVRLTGRGTLLGELRCVGVFDGTVPAAYSAWPILVRSAIGYATPAEYPPPCAAWLRHGFSRAMIPEPWRRPPGSSRSRCRL
jgi:hypothetical protein